MIPGFTDAFLLDDKVFDGEYWRYLTAIFLHGGITHLIYNLFGLLFFGFALEKLVGSRRFLIVFLGTGILANIVSVNFYDSSLGASGAIYGMLGVLTVAKPFMMVWAFGLIMPIFVAAGLWIIADVFRAMGMFGESNIGSIAHLSGIFIGFLIGFLFKRTEKRRSKGMRINLPDNYVRTWENAYIKKGPV
jgi:hypothetical protein